MDVIVDFFKGCELTVTSAEYFGLFDDTEMEDSPTEVVFPEEGVTDRWWSVYIINPKAIEVSHYGVDKCIVFANDNGINDRICDSMLTWNETIAFIEIKDRNKRAGVWAPDAAEQVASTINNFNICHPNLEFKTKVALIANKARPVFASSLMNLQNSFHNDTGFRLKIGIRLEIE